MRARAIPATLAALKAGGKPALARALAAAEATPEAADLVRLLDAAYAAPCAQVIGLTGPPGVGKSTLTSALVSRWRQAALSVGVIAIDPSSSLSGGALLGDRTRILTDPEDEGAFVRSLAARDRLGGLSDLTFAAVVLMRAVFDRVLVETVGIGQSESDIAKVADTVVFCVQPGSGDSLQFMKSGIMELPDVVAVTKADMGALALRARADVEGALSLSRRDNDGWRLPVVLVCADSGEGLEALDAVLGAHFAHLAARGVLAARRQAQALSCLCDALRNRFGSEGLKLVRARLDLTAGESPFSRERALSAELAARLAG